MSRSGYLFFIFLALLLFWRRFTVGRTYLTSGEIVKYSDFPFMGYFELGLLGGIVITLSYLFFMTFRK